MAQWRKVVVSGSSAVLNEVSASGNIVPKTTDGSSLGTTALQFSDLFLGEGAVINWDGGVSPCCIVDDSFSDFGNVLDNGFDGVWNNEYYVSARSEFSNTKNMTKSTICNVCKNDTHNPNLLRVGDSFSITLNKNVQFKK